MHEESIVDLVARFVDHPRHERIACSRCGKELHCCCPHHQLYRPTKYVVCDGCAEKRPVANAAIIAAI